MNINLNNTDNNDYVRGYKDGKKAGIESQQNEAPTMTNDKLPEVIISRINLEARQFAFYNYVTQLLHPNAEFENMDTWPNDARVCFYSILHYMSREDLCWPYKEPTLATEWAQWKVRYDEVMKEHSDLNLALAAMLNGYQNLSMYQKDWFTVPKDLIDCYTKMVLEYDKQGKEVGNG